MKRRLDVTVLVGGERETHSVWVGEQAPEPQKGAAVDELVADVRSWNDEPVELEGWGETGWVKPNRWGAEPRREPGW